MAALSIMTGQAIAAGAMSAVEMRTEGKSGWACRIRIIRLKRSRVDGASKAVGLDVFSTPPTREAHPC